jgi:hypothetical protein
MTKRKWSWVFLAAGIALFMVSAWHARHQLNVLARWTSTQGTLVQREVLPNHDADGYLFFEMRGTFRYLADRRELSSSALSPFGSKDFGTFARRFLAYQPGSQYTVRYNPAKPEEFEFGAGFNKVYFNRALQYLAAALACLALAFLLRQFSSRLKRCRVCRYDIKAFYRYCPNCGESTAVA